MFAYLKKIEKSLDSHMHDFTKIDLLDNFAEFNELIGLPQNPVTSQPTQLMSYQREFAKIVEESECRRFHINKSRQIGVTELILRILAYHCFHTYKGRKILIITGTRVDTARKLMFRFKALFRNIPEIIERATTLKMMLKNGTEIETLPSNSEAIRGETKIGAIFVDEAAHFDLIDDNVVLDAIEPIVFTNKSDLFLVSTPNGRRGFFYKLFENGNDYRKLQWDYTKAIGCTYTKEEIEKMLERTDINVDQEYRCKFTSSNNATFTEEMIKPLRNGKNAIDLSTLFEKNN